jgi:hypothetical protein
MCHQNIIIVNLYEYNLRTMRIKEIMCISLILESAWVKIHKPFISKFS